MANIGAHRMPATAAAAAQAGQYTPATAQGGTGAHVDFYLKIDGIEGESEDSKHAKEIEVLSWSWGESQSGTFASGGGGGGGKVAMNDFNFLALTSKASPKLILACAEGQHIKSAVFSARKAGGGQQDYLKITMSDIIVSSYSVSAGSEIPTEGVSLNFAKIEVEYKPQKKDGSLDAPVKIGYDLKKNAKV